MVDPPEEGIFVRMCVQVYFCTHARKFVLVRIYMPRWLYEKVD